MKYISTFPYYSYHIDSKNYDKQSLIETMLSNYKINPIRNNWDDICDIHHEFNDRSNEDFTSPDYNILIPLYKNVIQQFIDELNFIKPVRWEFSIENYTVTTNKQHMISHNHIPSHYAAVHYLSFDSDLHKSTVFKNPSQYGSIFNLYYNNIKEALPENSPHAVPFKTDYVLPVEEDEIIIFPSILDHYVTPSNTSKPRVTVALNIIIDTV